MAAKIRTLSEQLGFLAPRPVLVTYISHYPVGWQGRPFLCCREHIDAWALLDWLKQRELQYKPTTITGWQYTDGGEPSGIRTARQAIALEISRR